MIVALYVLLRRKNMGAVYVISLSMSADAKCTEVLSERQPRIFLLERLKLILNSMIFFSAVHASIKW